MVDAAVAAMAIDTTIGLSQEMYHADDQNEFDFQGHNDASESEVLDFCGQNNASFSAWQSNAALTMTPKEILAPRLKELASVYEHRPEKLIEVAALLDKLIQQGKAENAAMQTKPVGHFVSALAPNKRLQHTHIRQKAHH